MWVEQRKAERLLLLLCKQNLQTNSEWHRRFVKTVKEDRSENQRRPLHSEYG